MVIDIFTIVIINLDIVDKFFKLKYIIIIAIFSIFTNTIIIIIFIIFYFSLIRIDVRCVFFVTS